MSIPVMRNIALDARTANNHFPGIGRYVAGLCAGMASIVDGEAPLLIETPGGASGRYALPDWPRLWTRSSPFSLRQQWEIPALLRRAGAQLYHSPYYLMPYRVGMPAVVTCYDLIPLVLPEYFSVFQRVIFRAIHRWLALSASRLIVISQSTRADLLQHFAIDPHKVVAIPLAADKMFRPALKPAELADWCRQAGLPGDFVLYVGSNKPHKNLPSLVRAWSILLRDWRENWGAPPLLVLAGKEDPRYPEARQLVRSLELSRLVRFMPEVSDGDLTRLYNAAQAFVFPSLYEGFGLPVLEAMACGRAVACSRSSSLPEVAGEAALYFDPTDVHSIADTLARLITDRDLQEELGERSLQRAQCFTWESTARETLAVYRDVFSGKRH